MRNTIIGDDVTHLHLLAEEERRGGGGRGSEDVLKEELRLL
jgi:hypothetical protein